MALACSMASSKDVERLEHDDRREHLLLPDRAGRRDVFQDGRRVQGAGGVVAAQQHRALGQRRVDLGPGGGRGLLA